MSWTRKVYHWKDGKEDLRKGELANEDWKEDGIKGSGALVIFVMGGGYGEGEQEVACKNIEEEGERAGGTFSESSTFFVAFALPWPAPK